MTYISRRYVRGVGSDVVGEAMRWKGSFYYGVGSDVVGEAMRWK